MTTNHWAPHSWRSKKIIQVPNYPNKKKQDCIKKANEIFESILKERKIKEISSLKRLSI